MLEMEAPGVLPTNNARSANHAHDTKRFRLRAVSHVGEIYARYFHSRLAHRLSWAQMILAAVITLLQVTMATTLQLERNVTSSLELVSWGAWGSCLLISSASLLTMWASLKPSYAKLHSAMGLNIAGVCTLSALLYVLKTLQIPSLMQELTLLRGDGSNYSPTLFQSQQAFEDEVEHKLRHGKLVAACIMGSTLLGSVVLGQILLSLFMAFKTGRAICCGRAHLEGKFLEMEAVSKDKESADAIVNFRMSRRESSISSVSPPSPTFSANFNHSSSDSPPPPPYSPPVTTKQCQGTQVKLTELREEVNVNTQAN